MPTDVERLGRTLPQVSSRVREYLRKAVGNPRWMLMDAVSRFVLARGVVRRVRARSIATEYSLPDSRFSPIDVDAFVSAVNRDGFCAGLTLPGSAVREILHFAETLPCFGDTEASLGFFYRDKARAQSSCRRVFSQATYLNRDGLQSTLDRLANDPSLLSLAARYLQAPPVITGTRMWWTFAAAASNFDNSVTTSFFHYDKDDYAALRLFFYLTDVDAGHGPHVVVKGSHRAKALSQLIALGERTDADIINRYGIDSLTKIVGKAGQGFAEDPFCFHKATRPIVGDRLMIELKYARRDYRSFPAVEKSKLAMIPLELYGSSCDQERLAQSHLAAVRV